MTRLNYAAMASSLFLASSAWADNTTKVEPGKSPTATMSEQVPTMKGKCADEQAAAKPPSTEATGAIDKAVPPMKPGDKPDCASSNATTGQ